MAAQRWFVVREEGGEYEFMSRRRWLRERAVCPIWGVRVGRTLKVYDKIILRQGFDPWRENTYWSAEALADFEHKRFLRLLSGTKH